MVQWLWALGSSYSDYQCHRQLGASDEVDEPSAEKCADTHSSAYNSHDFQGSWSPLQLRPEPMGPGLKSTVPDRATRSKEQMTEEIKLPHRKHKNKLQMD